MAKRRQSLRNLAKLLPSGVAGLSMGLAQADAWAALVGPPATDDSPSVADRLQALRGDVSSALEQYAKDGEPFVAIDPQAQLAWWGNGWRNGGWHNGGWGNGGWHNGGWGNGGWHNGGWGNGWHNW